MLSRRLLVVGGGILALLITLVIIVLVTRAKRPAPYVAGPPACTHYASPTGSGTACTQTSPCTVWTFVSHSTLSTTGGNVLCLNDGTYTGQIDIPTTFQGTPDKPIWIRALNEGRVTFNQGGSGFAIRTQGSYGVLWGVNIINGKSANLLVRGTHWTIQRVVCGSTARVDVEDNLVLAGTYNLVEDVAVFGVGGKQFVAGVSQTGATHNVARRVFTIFNDMGDKYDPVGAGELGYGQDNVLFENVIATHNQLGSSPAQGQGPMQTFRSDNSQVLGSIFYVSATAVWPPNALFFASTDGGSQFAAGSYDPSDNNRFRHLVAYIDPAHPNFSTTRAFLLDYESPGWHGTGNTFQDSVGVSGLTMTCRTTDYTCTNIQTGANLAEAIGAGKSLWTDSVAGPGVCKRYINGTLTETGLWPWPMEQRLAEAMIQAGETPIYITQTMEQLFGSIPSQCRTDGTPILPEPVALACTGTISALPGPIQMRCVPEVTRR
jgi:hypothetical protein